MTPPSTSRVDLHCHSTASAVSKLGVQRALGLPECATPPEEVYELAKRRGMDFVTITDHDTIDGALELAARHDDAFVSEELTAWFRGEPQAVHVLCWGITADDHERLQALVGDVEAVADELRERAIACALAHPFYAVEAPLMPRHRRRLAQLFPIWETRNGSRARELNAPAVVYIETHGGTGVGGSDDHAGVDIGRTFTETPRRADLARVPRPRRRSATPTARGEQGSAAKWAHAAMGLAVARARAAAPTTARRPGPGGGPRDGRAGDARGRRAQRRDRRRPRPRRRPRAAARLAGAGRARPRRRRELLAHLQDDDFSHADLFRRARRCHERKLARRGRRDRRGARRAARDLARAPRRRCSTPAWRRSPTRRPRRSSAARRRSSPAATASRCASRSSPTASAACTASRTRSTSSASAACPASRSRSSAPTRTSTGG